MSEYSYVIRMESVTKDGWHSEEKYYTKEEADKKFLELILDENISEIWKVTTDHWKCREMELPPPEEFKWPTGRERN